MSIQPLRRLPALLLMVLWCGYAASRADHRPNVLFLLADDQRADTISALGNPYIRTPNLDQLVRRGFAFTRAYCMGSQVQAVCMPSRAMMLTGRGLFAALRASDDWGRIPVAYATWPELLRAAGY